MFDPACPGDPDVALAGNVGALYNLEGAQVEPTAGYWTLGFTPELIRVVPVVHVVNLAASDPQFSVPRYPNQQAVLDWELEELVQLESLRDDPTQIAGGFAVPPPPGLDPIFADTARRPLSRFLSLDPPPFGAIFNIGSRPQQPLDNINQQHLRLGNVPPLVTTGRQLARMFQDETPGLAHRHALNYLLYKRVFVGDAISPPRQARIWMALDVTIYSALIAAWYYKWVHDVSSHSYRQRPYEYDRNQRIRVLYDDFVDDLGEFNKCARTAPCPSPGTPRHPAYPSGHSTYSAAASEILAYFFPEERMELENLADNIGTARLWAGVHWRSDHIAGRRIGLAVAELVKRQLRQDCVPPVSDVLLQTPTHADLRQIAELRNRACVMDQDVLPTQRTVPFEECAPPDASNLRAI